MSSILERVRRWRVNAAMGPAHREARKTRYDMRHRARTVDWMACLLLTRVSLALA